MEAQNQNPQEETKKMRDTAVRQLENDTAIIRNELTAKGVQLR